MIRRIYDTTQHNLAHATQTGSARLGSRYSRWDWALNMAIWSRRERPLGGSGGGLLGGGGSRWGRTCFPDR